MQPARDKTSSQIRPGDQTDLIPNPCSLQDYLQEPETFQGQLHPHREMCCARQRGQCNSTLSRSKEPVVKGAVISTLESLQDSPPQQATEQQGISVECCSHRRNGAANPHSLRLGVLHWGLQPMVQVQTSVNAISPWPTKGCVILRLQQSAQSRHRNQAICQGHCTAEAGSCVCLLPAGTPCPAQQPTPEAIFLSPDTQRHGENYHRAMCHSSRASPCYET